MGARSVSMTEPCKPVSAEGVVLRRLLAGGRHEVAAERRDRRPLRTADVLPRTAIAAGRRRCRYGGAGRAGSSRRDARLDRPSICRSGPSTGHRRRIGRRSTPVSPSAGAGAFTTDDPLQRILGALGGAWSWDGEFVYAPDGSLRFDGSLNGRDLVYRGRSIGHLDARVAYDENGLTIHSATLVHPDGGEIRARGGIVFGTAPRFTLGGESRGYPVRDLLAIASVDVAIDGPFGASFTLAGEPASPERPAGDRQRSVPCREP